LEDVVKRHVGFIGLGEMGQWMALNILNKGLPLVVHDLRVERTRELVKHGAEAAHDLSEIAIRCDRIVLSLPDSSVVESVVFGSHGLKTNLKRGDIIIDCGTTSPIFTRQTSAILKEEGVIFLDAPVSGMEAGAKEGTLTIMVGGDEGAYLKICPVLEAIGENVVYMGASGNGQLAKMTNNVLFNISCAAMAEILPLATKMGLDPEKVCSVVRTGTGQSFGFDFFSPYVLEGNFKPGYPMESAYKDMAAVIELAATYHIPLPVTCSALQTYQMALGQGLGRENKGAMVKVWERVLGVTVRRNNKR
jgi:3-hydroxyisobutyrate dehydrogenase-like beta-hydroxyacid dehydrogenase